MAGRDNDDDDVESQTSTSQSSGTAASRKSYLSGAARLVQAPVWMNLDKATAARFTTQYGFEPIVRTSEPFHAHPHLAYERNTLERRAIKWLDRNYESPLIADVGSGARRHAHSNIHCLMPYLQPGDDIRLATAMKNGNTLCTHRLQECDCRTFGALLFVHSAYYFTADEVAQALEKTSRKVALVVGHRFPEALGSLAWGEGEYKHVLSSTIPLVQMRVRGNEHRYTHPPLPWDGGREALLKDGTALDVTLHEQMGDTFLWIVTYNKRRPVRFDGPWADWLRTESGNTVAKIPGWDSIARQNLATIGIEDTSIDELHGYGKWVFATYGNRGRVFMPRGAIAAVARKLHNKPRDPALWRDASFYMGKLLEGVPMDEGDKLIAQTVGTAVAFCVNVKPEVDASNTAVTRYGPLWKMHATLMSLKPINTVSVWLVVFIATGTVVIVIGLAGSAIVTRNDDATDKALYVGPWFVAGFIALPCCVVYSVHWCVARRQTRATRENWTGTLTTEQRAVSVTDTIYLDAENSSFPAFRELRQPLLPPQGGVLRLGDDPRPPKHPGTERTNVITLGGFGFATAVPSAPRTDVEAEVTALTHRLLTAPTHPDANALDMLYDWETSRDARIITDIRIQPSAAMYIDWMAQKKFSAAQREKFQDVYERKVLGEDNPPRGRFSAFVKFEKMKAITRGDLEGLKVRLISGPPDAVKVAVGPWICRIQAGVQAAWDGRNSRILWAAGRTPDYIGKVCDEFAESIGGWENVIGVWDDEALYDSTLENELLKTRDILYPRMGMDEKAMAWLHSVSPSGVTAHGVTYRLGKKVTADGREVEVIKLFSGEMDTNLIGTIINGKAHLDALPTDWPFLMLVNGDDNLILGDRRTFNIKIANDLKAHLESLGLKPTQGVSIERSDWEFCSKLLWWGVDPATGQKQTVLGPKPGRWLHRIGWSVSDPRAPNFREAMLSSAQDVNHIPLLREYVQRGIRLSAGQKRRGSEWSEMKHVSKSFDGHPDNYELLYRRYLISAEHVLAFEAALLNVVSCPVVLDVPWLEAAAKRDEE